VLGLAPTILLSTGAGVSFAAMGLAYRWGETKHVRPQMVLWGACVLGAALFLARCIALGQFWQTPPRVVLWAVAGSLGQYVAIVLMGRALKRGTFGPVWCALTLTFIPVAIYTTFFTDEHSSVWRWIAIALAVGCVVVASMDPSLNKDHAARKHHGSFLFALLLLMLMFTNGIVNVGLKDLGLPHPPTGPLVPAFRDAFMFILYFVFVIAISIEWLFRRRNIPQLRVVAGPAILCAIGSLLGIGLMTEASSGPSFLPFVISGILSVVGGFLGAAVFFKDKLTWISWLVIALGVASVSCTAF
jgi:drug/metabolite transporter (DMT)-like permease